MISICSGGGAHVPKRGQFANETLNKATDLEQRQTNCMRTLHQFDRGKLLSGGWYWTRTSDLVGVNDALCRLS